MAIDFNTLKFKPKLKEPELAGLNKCVQALEDLLDKKILIGIYQEEDGIRFFEADCLAIIPLNEREDFRLRVQVALAHKYLEKNWYKVRADDGQLRLIAIRLSGGSIVNVWARLWFAKYPFEA